MVIDVIKYGHPVLRQPGKRVSQITADIRQLAADMIETMNAANGVGLAAQQVGRALMLTVIDVSESDLPSQLLVEGQPADLAAHMPLVLLNPTLTGAQGEQTSSEGCLSIPEISADIRRAERVIIQAQDLDGQVHRYECVGLLARAAQHEVDHLHGILFIDRMDAATRASLAGKLKKMQKETRAGLKGTAKTPPVLAGR